MLDYIPGQVHCRHPFVSTLVQVLGQEASNFGHTICTIVVVVTVVAADDVDGGSVVVGIVVVDLIDVVDGVVALMVTVVGRSVVVTDTGAKDVAKKASFKQIDTKKLASFHGS